MNRPRRNKISAIISSIEDLKAQVEALQNEEQETFDNMPENLQQSERGQMAESAANNLECAANDLENVIDQLNEAMQ